MSTHTVNDPSAHGGHAEHHDDHHGGHHEVGRAHAVDHHRVHHDVEGAKEHLMGLAGINTRALINNVINPHDRGSVQMLRTDLRRQLLAAGADEGHVDQEVDRLVSIQKADPGLLREHALRPALEGSMPYYENITWTVPGAPTMPVVDVTVDYTNPYWNTHRTTEQIYTAIHNHSEADLGAMGIHISSVQPVGGFAETEARRLAERIHIPFMRPVFSVGMVSEANSGFAQLLLQEHPEMLEVLKLKDPKADAEKKAGRKILAQLIAQLKAFPEKSYGETFQDAEEELKKIVADQAAINSATATYTSQAFINSGYTTGPVAPGDRRYVIQEAAKQAQHLGQVRDYYNSAAGLFRRISDQIDRLSAANVSQPIGRAPLYEGVYTLPAADRARGFSLTVTPRSIADELSGVFHELIDEAEKSIPATSGEKKTEKKENPPVGAHAVIKVYQEYFEKHARDHHRSLLRLSPDEARRRAFELYFNNEFTSEESHFIEHEVRHLAGGEVSKPRQIWNNVKSYVSGYFGGSNEAYILKVAEKVGVPKGSGSGGYEVFPNVPEWISENLPTNVVNYVRGHQDQFREARRFGKWTTAGIALGYATNPWLGLTATLPWLAGTAANKLGLAGTRRFGLIPKYHVLPNWGAISTNRHSLRRAWKLLIHGVKSGKLDRGNEYVIGQLMELAKMMLPSLHQELAETMAGTEMTPEMIEKFMTTNKRAFMQDRIHKMIHDALESNETDADLENIGQGRKAVVGKAAKFFMRWLKSDKGLLSLAPDEKKDEHHDDHGHGHDKAEHKEHKEFDDEFVSKLMEKMDAMRNKLGVPVDKKEEKKDAKKDDHAHPPAKKDDHGHAPAKKDDHGHAPKGGHH